MRPAKSHPRGAMLILAVASTGIVMLLLSCLTLFAGARYRDTQTTRVRVTARAAADSVAAYARERLQEWSVTPPAAPVEVDIRGLLTPEMNGSAIASVIAVQDRKVCRIRVEVSRGPSVIADEFDLALEK
ncbi:MAG TPA: hypothetical protein PKY77_03235 [Phycisphaerae bacterium]|nr:hypothetical protein [Phycisphaerae bacterium]HRY67387.1 hypothetical protein [Phycisphaerae bacterium]HSA29321.1 hypothetical protein [Phycisphaerae bacterium]